ncbi:hypothetical protein [Lentzea sp. NBRC 102530]|uniref:hypothetical protein n=1 Tax=Lentzea sp. NBRC 102530 TaxID=3032201 RepID=UPI0024A05A2D|nr:hypothetical protein [Lentzea sp. NBRC 102530]GLY54468.1 hypothetical protein Lesp01_81240 [Lentzea sp. NBRC 102530]
MTIDHDGTRHADLDRDTRELLDPHHHRASIHVGDQLIVDPDQVLANVALAMERLDLDTSTPVSIDEDVASIEELVALVDHFEQGPALIAHTLNTAARVMNARYPAEPVHRPLPSDCDLRRLFHADVDERSQDIARAVFNRRLARMADVSAAEIAVDVHELTSQQRIEVFMAVFFLYGTKVGALQNRTGIR